MKAFLILLIPWAIVCIGFITAYRRVKREFTREVRNAWESEAAARRLAVVASELNQSDKDFLRRIKEADEKMIEGLLQQNERLQKHNSSLRSSCVIYQMTLEQVTSFHEELDRLMKANPSGNQALHYPIYAGLSAVIRNIPADFEVAESGDLIAHILKTLPEQVCYEGVVFGFRLRIASGYLSLSYEVIFVQLGSPHIDAWAKWRSWFSPFHEGQPKNFLWLKSEISHELELDNAIVDCRLFLEEQKLIP